MSVPPTTSRFSTGLQFTKKDLQTGVPAGNAEIIPGAAILSTLLPPLSEEERLDRHAKALRRTIAEELGPRLESLDEQLRVVHRRLAALRHHLPSEAFVAYQHRCCVRSRQLEYFEEITVQKLLKEAVETAAAAGACPSAEAARWKKSNQWPALTSFVELQLYLCAATNVKHGDDKTTTSATTTTEAVREQLEHLWQCRLTTQLNADFLDRYFALKDVLFGWGRGWYLRPACPEGVGVCETESTTSNADDDLIVPCPGSKWDKLTASMQLESYSRLCSRHLSEVVASTLEEALASEFTDVWTVVKSALQ